MKKLNLEDILANTQDLSKEKLVGFVSILGRPNTGKSTFVNSLIGEKISITSNVPQTTRKKVLAIYNDDDSQIVFLDTPGVHESNKDFNNLINKEAVDTLNTSDLILYFIDSSRIYGKEEEYIENLIKEVNVPVLKVFTKSDRTNKIEIGDEEIKISSITQDGFPILLNRIKGFLKKGEILFPEDYYTKQDIYFRINEIIREKVFLYTKEEVPHAIYVTTEAIDEDEKLMKIASYIFTESDSQKYIIVGKGGSLITKIGKEAREELENIFGKKVFLALKVKVNKNWKNNKKITKSLFN